MRQHYCKRNHHLCRSGGKRQRSQHHSDGTVEGQSAAHRCHPGGHEPMEQVPEQDHLRPVLQEHPEGGDHRLRHQRRGSKDRVSADGHGDDPTCAGRGSLYGIHRPLLHRSRPEIHHLCQTDRQGKQRQLYLLGRHGAGCHGPRDHRH